MDIQTTQVNSVQQFSAANAFRANKNITKPAERDEINSLSGTQTTSGKTLLDGINTEDIRKYASYVGEFNISDDDIKYGMLYGRSVIAEWLC